MLENQKEILPYSRSVVVTETNHVTKDNGQWGWENDGTWLRFAYDYFRDQGVSGACAFRHTFDRWNIDDKPQVLEAVVAG